jgi:hypothetical protein
MAFRYFRTMRLWVGEDAVLTLSEAPSRYYTPMLLRSKVRLTMDESLNLFARVASAAQAAQFIRRCGNLGSFSAGNPRRGPLFVDVSQANRGPRTQGVNAKDSIRSAPTG